MPFLVPEPWEEYLFAFHHTHTNIPLYDEYAFELYPSYNWVYNKMAICNLQEIWCVPHGIEPKEWPAFSKPIYNLFGMGIDAKEVDKNTFEYKSGHMLTKVFDGRHFSIDVAVLNNRIRWFCITEGFKDHQTGNFDFWKIGTDDNYAWKLIEKIEWFLFFLKGYNGIVNFEFIDDKIIEVHLRISTQFTSFYIEKIGLTPFIALYDNSSWYSGINTYNTGYSIPIFSDQLIDIPKGIPNFFDTRDDEANKKLSQKRLGYINTPDLNWGLNLRKHILS